MSDSTATTPGVNDYSPEIETATASMLWHHPDWLAQFLREHDPDVVFFQPHVRRIVQAINIAYSELGLADWPDVVQVIRELGAYEEVGGLDGLSALYAAVVPTEFDRRCFGHYCDMLKRYAIAREHQVRLYRFVRGDFLLEPNRLKRGPNGPDYVGTGRFGGRLYRVAGFAHTQGIRLSILPV